jgi:hypothetical protein
MLKIIYFQNSKKNAFFGDRRKAELACVGREASFSVLVKVTLALL